MSDPGHHADPYYALEMIRTLSTELEFTNLIKLIENGG